MHSCSCHARDRENVQIRSGPCVVCVSLKCEFFGTGESAKGPLARFIEMGMVEFDEPIDCYKLEDGHGGTVWFNKYGAVVDVEYD